MSFKDPKFYLWQINESISFIKQYSDGFAEKTFCEDRKTIDAVLMQIMVIGESCSRLDAIGYCALQPSVPWSKIRGMRNLIAHDYARVAPSEVWNSISIITTEFSDQISSLLKQSDATA